MHDLPEHLKYASSHEWAQLENARTVRVGITDFAQQSLGDLVYVQLPEVGRKVSSGEQCAVVESVKTASDLFSPVSGTITAINESVVDAPEQVNDAPYQTWLFCVEADNIAELDNLMDAETYRVMVGD